MRAVHATDLEEFARFEPVRPHPWGRTLYSDETEDYVDLKATPELADAVAVDFASLQGTGAHATFLALLRWINGPQSVFESNDCALLTPAMNDARPQCRPSWAFGQRYACGRLMFLQRAVELNLDIAANAELLERLIERLGEQPDLDGVEVGVSRCPTFYRAVAQDDDDPRAFGEQFQVEWLIGAESDEAVVAQMRRALECIRAALELVSGEWATREI